MKKYCFGADIGGTTMKLGLFDADGMVLDKWEVPTHTENEGERFCRIWQRPFWIR